MGQPFRGYTKDCLLGDEVAQPLGEFTCCLVPAGGLMERDSIADEISNENIASVDMINIYMCIHLTCAQIMNITEHLAQVIYIIWIYVGVYAYMSIYIL